LRHDIAALEKIWADDYIFANADGDVVPKGQRLTNIKSGATMLESIKEENIAIRVYQNSAASHSRANTAVGRPAANSEYPCLGKRFGRLAVSL